MEGQIISSILNTTNHGKSKLYFTFISDSGTLLLEFYRKIFKTKSKIIIFNIKFAQDVFYIDLLVRII